MAYADEVLADSPGAYWRLGTSPLTDASGNGNTLTAENAATEVDGLLVGDADKARDFDGVDDAYTAADSATLDVGDVFTLECWLRIDSLASQMRVLDKGANAYDLNINTSGIVHLTKTTVGTVVVSSIALSVDTVYHVVATKNGSAEFIYINGVDRSDTSGQPDHTFENNTSVLFLGRFNTGGDFFNGVLDEVAVYPTALSAARIQAHYDAGQAAGVQSILRPAMVV